MSGWQEAYDTGAFEIVTNQPSQVVKDYAHLIPDGSRVADLGCGAGRNALYLASLGFTVSAYDVVDVGWSENLGAAHSASIEFDRKDVANVCLGENVLGAVLMMRLIQYLPLVQVNKLVTDARQSLINDGVLFMNYTVYGGIHDIPKIDVKKHQHPFSKVLDIVSSAGFQVIYSQEADMKPSHTNLDSGDIHACDLVAIA